MYTLQQYIAPILPDLALAALGIAVAVYGIWGEFNEYRKRCNMSAKHAGAVPAHGAKAEGMGNNSAHTTRQPAEAARCESGA